ncbi:tenascin-R [Elysia marginata]|uniref:Tenascin-R n=1 Tax=Elysia marginata TaxID=1093978 RepID=A0AAV4II99_9GAST|nr:tenascin-R [Elysia marginata]
MDEDFVLLTHEIIGRQIRCDALTDGGGWIVVQRRAVGDVDFYRNWSDYRDGFGNLTGDFWLGNEDLHKLTNEHSYQLRIDFVADGQPFYAEYPSILVEDETNLYRLHLGAYSKGNVEEVSGSGMSHSDLGPFSTFDRDNDSYSSLNCAVSYHAAWWYRQCSAVNLNGEWGTKNPRGMRWYNGRVHRYATFVEMKIRRI